MRRFFFRMKQEMYAIGVMSGTSLDGVDLVYTKITYDHHYSYNIIASDTIPYSDIWQKKLREAFTSSALEITKLNITYAKLLGTFINTFITKHNLKKIDFIASHGHTIFHNPEESYTLQIGDGATLAQMCNINVVSDFRTQDVAMGGQGAPLVPIGDLLFFKEYDYCVNIGGFANISFDENSVRQAFDICPANIILNHFTRKLGKAYDDQGKIAKSGTINTDLLKKLNHLKLYNKKNAMGYEVVLSDFIPLINSYQLSVEDVLQTYVEHIAMRIAKSLQPNTKTLVTGGGAYNTYLINRLQYYSDSEIILPNNELINYKEALIFALLGFLKIQNKPNILASVTGALKDHSGGVYFKV